MLKTKEAKHLEGKNEETLAFRFGHSGLNQPPLTGYMEEKKNQLP